MNAGCRILLAGEAWTTYTVHQKGFSAFTVGAYDEGAQRLIAALAGQGHLVDYVPTINAAVRFPQTLSELAAYDVVVLSDIGADTLLLHPDTFERGQRTPDRLSAINAFVGDGGGLLMIGGYMSFSGIGGQARYGSTCLQDVLPVEMECYDDRVEAPAGVTPRKASDHPILEGIDPPWPYLLGYNRVRAKDAGESLLVADHDPLLVVGEYGTGRAAAFASDCAPHWGSRAFLEWDYYDRFWSQLVSWLGEPHRLAADRPLR